MYKPLLGAVFAAFVTPTLAADGACYDYEAIQPAVTAQGELSTRAEQLVRLAIAEGASREHVYILGRQMVLIERLHRRLLERADCGAGKESLARDFVIMQRVFKAFAAGDADLRVTPLKAEQAQSLLGEIERHAAELGTSLVKLGVPGA